MQGILASVAFSIFIALIGCSGGDDENLLIDEALLKEWTLTSIEMEDGSVLDAETSYTIAFSRRHAETLDFDVFIEGLAVNIFDGCNFCTGVYRLPEDGLLGIIIDSCTLIACVPPPVLEALYGKALNEASSYEVQGDAFRIFSTDWDSGKKNILNFITN